MTTLPIPLEKREPKKVVILGGGMSGLVAALELERAGHLVTIVEARSRVGGRVLTMRDATGTAVAEAGAGRIPSTHAWATHYLEWLSLETEPLYPQGLHPAIYARGKRVTAAIGTNFADQFDLTSAEKTIGLEGLAKAYLAPGVERVRASGAMDGAGWPPAGLLALDKQTVRQYLSGEGLSDVAVDLLTVGAFPQNISALTFFRVLATYDRNSLVKIRGGNDKLPQAIAARLKSRLLLERAVRSIDQEPGHTVVTMETSNGLEKINADYVICTIPFSLLPNIAFAPVLSSEKQKIMREMQYQKATKVAFKTRGRPWEREGLSGFAQLDSMAEIWSARRQEQSDGGVLQLYQQGDLAGEMDSMDSRSRIAFATATLERVFPGVGDLIEETFEHSWQSDQWAKGAYGIAPAGRLYGWKENLSAPEGRVHFAGEHTSLEYAAWIEGAIRSGYRAAVEVNARDTVE